ncbi:ABC transporter permease subunit [Paenibacillus nasutitermitis]|uniref:Sugar ABC transporter permease n=1 Tax=Paenibacillus nasutitermitis TaxID=1652958 RepID=A0A916YKJ7_9BACL|nr:ABC transporter permease subunit [Paenibacillus nasutitermitis]GGD49703.1 sugar ABC transporter permease [Paenibacillus nasutitermitis]
MAHSLVSVKKEKFRKKKPRKSMVLLLMAIPFVLLVFAFNYVPLFGWIYSFYNFKPGIPLDKTPFVGFDYFKILVTEGREDIIRVLKNTLALSFLLILCSPLPALLAILLNEVKSKRFRRIIQTTTTLPNFISWVIVFSLAFSMFSSEGLINKLLLDWHVIKEPMNVLGNGEIVWPFQTAINVWKNIGFSSIIYIAAIAGIDNELYEAAKVDGASRLRTILHITLPGISSTFFVLLLLQISNILSAGFEQYLVFYNSLVSSKIEVLDYYVYKLGIVTSDYSYATTIGMLKTVISIILLFSVNYLSKKVRGNSII